MSVVDVRVAQAAQAFEVSLALVPRVCLFRYCHPPAAESLAQPRTPNEGSVHSGGGVAEASCIDPSAHKEPGPQDDSVGMTALGRQRSW